MACGGGLVNQNRFFPTVGHRDIMKIWHAAAVAAAVLLQPLAVVVAQVPVMEPRPTYDWEAQYAYWRHNDTVPLSTWRENIPPAIPVAMPGDVFAALPEQNRTVHFRSCLRLQAKTFASHVLRYRSPELSDIASAVRVGLDARQAKVVVAVFWGRERYVSILWPYLERNLRSNGGCVDEVRKWQVPCGKS